MVDEKLDATGMQSSMAQRDDGITLLAVYHFLVAGLFLLATVVLAFPTLILGVVAITEDAGALIGMFAVGLIGAVTMVFCLVYLSVGYGLWKLKQWARVAAIALAVISLFAVPIGTAIGVATLWYLQKTEVAEEFA